MGQGVAECREEAGWWRWREEGSLRCFFRKGVHVEMGSCIDQVLLIVSISSLLFAQQGKGAKGAEDVTKGVKEMKV